MIIHLIQEWDCSSNNYFPSSGTISSLLKRLTEQHDRDLSINKLKNIISLSFTMVFYPPCEGCWAKLRFFDGQGSGRGYLHFFIEGIQFYQLTSRNCYRRDIWNCCLDYIIIFSNRGQSFALFTSIANSSILVSSLTYHWSAWFYLIILWYYLYYVFSVRWLLLLWLDSVGSYGYYQRDLLF